MSSLFPQKNLKKHLHGVHELWQPICILKLSAFKIEFPNKLIQGVSFILSYLKWLKCALKNDN